MKGFPSHWTTLRRLIFYKAILAGGSAETLTATGVSPLSLLNAVAHSIVSLTQYGKCVQNSTPTPDAPADIWCNNGKIVVSRNMCDVSEANVVVGKYINNSGVETSDTANFYYATYIPVTPGGTYTMATSSSIWYFSVMQYDSSKNFLRRSIWGATNTPVGTEKTFDIGSDCAYIRFGSNMRKANISLSDVLAVNWMLTQSETAETYHPYKDWWVEGTDEVLTVCGKNLFNKTIADANRIYGYFAETGKSWTFAAAGFSFRFPCKPNTTYTARYNGNETQAVLGFGSTSSDEVPVSAGKITITQAIRQSSPTISTPVTLTTGASDKWLIVAFNSTDPQHTDMLDNLQVEEGSTATEYAAYTAQTATVPDLFGVGDYKDEAELIAGIKARKVGVLVLDGTGTWVMGGTKNQFYSDDVFTDRLIAGRDGFCTHFTFSTNVSDLELAGYVLFGSSTQRINFSSVGFTDVTEWKAYLAAQYAAGTPVSITYPLATPTTEQTTPHSLHTVAGTNTVSVESNVDPVTLAVEYKGKSA